jgi:hypothetical protein
MGSRKKLAVPGRGMTRHAGVAQHKGHGCQGQRKGKKTVPRTQKGWTFRKRHWAQPEFNNGIRDRGAIRQLHLRKEMTTSNGIRGWSRRQDLYLGSVKALHETRGQALQFEFTKQTVGTSIRLRKMTARTLWSGRPPPKWKKRVQTE